MAETTVLPQPRASSICEPPPFDSSDPERYFGDLDRYFGRRKYKNKLDQLYISGVTHTSPSSTV
ncbi:Hypothetical protein FKW44_020592 [Caligus rogercresseyi]|uniref:Uncharacterized protein n=1 Tax=Caligus rogercresseyi TaxID=217165 RepID=A0A7T8GYA2_CALRO|nr:Hypothetical protein FKW44_020592 [Caligus rogercresseyi]